MTNDVVAKRSADVIQSARAKVLALQEAILALPGSVKGDIRGNVGFPVEHHFANGVYCRKLTLPAVSYSVGKIHRYPTNNILLKGRIAIVNPEQDDDIHEAPCIWQSPGGSQRAVYAFEETIWVTTHPVDKSYTEADLDTIEAEVIVNDFEQLDRERT